MKIITSDKYLMSYLWNTIFFHVSICIFSIVLYEALLTKISFNYFEWIISASNETTSHYSSVSCRGSNHTDRVCMFKNLYYDTSLKKFVFFHSSESTIQGVPEDRFSPALTDFSSVYDHNTQYFNFVDLPYSALSNFEVKVINGVSLVFKRFNPENLMHVFHDDLIPAFVTLDEFFALHRADVQFVFADGKGHGPYAYLYDDFLVTKPLYLASLPFQMLCFEKAIVGLNKNSLWYQYGFKKPQSQLNKDLSGVYPNLINFRSYFYKHFSIQNVSSGNGSALLLTREHNRRILNTKDVAAFIQKKLSLTTTVMNLENHSVIDIVQKIITCKLLVGIHGSLLILSIFLPPNSHIIELFPYAVSPDISTPYRTLEKIPGLKINYWSWENKIEKNSFPHPEYPAELGGILHLSEEKQESIKKSSVKPFLCCYNPEWLYRIYQDTIVDLNSLSNVINVESKGNPSNADIIERIYPSEVQNVLCSLSSIDTFNITWEPPWNVNFISNSILEYELWYQDEDEIKAFIMKRNYFVFKEKVSSAVYVWIRCHMNNNTGPFNTDPLICLKT